MMLLVTYSLKVPGRDYGKLYETLKSSRHWCHYLESTWLIVTDESVEVWRDKLIAVMDENDRLLVADITNSQLTGLLPRKAWDWLNRSKSKA